MKSPKSRDKRALIFRTVILLVIIFVVGAVAVVRIGEKQVSLDQRMALAQCLTDKGAKMYGAYWCPHCVKQKKEFGEAFPKVTYIECAISGDPNAQKDECKKENITGYPTWTFADSSRASGELSFEDLAKRAGCPWEVKK